MGETFYSATDKRCKTSALEEQILKKLGELGLDLVPQIKRRSWVFDAGVQGTKILIEINGDYWHSLPHAKERDQKKAAWASQHGYTIITITEGAYQEDPETVLLQVVEQVEQLRERTKVDTVDTDAPISSYTFDDWRDDFIASLSGDLNIRHACIAADISRSAAYKRRETDDEFRLAWDEAIENAADLLEGVYWKRAVEQSDRALEFLLKAARPEKYRERSEVQAKHSGAVEHVHMSVDEWKAQAAARLADAEATLRLLDEEDNA
jgi:very-short-patch-repair endonuclease